MEDNDWLRWPGGAVRRSEICGAMISADNFTDLVIHFREGSNIEPVVLDWPNYQSENYRPADDIFEWLCSTEDTSLVLRVHEKDY